MPTIDELVRPMYTTKQWLTYYRNIWFRNSIAGCIDVQYDLATLAKDPLALEYLTTGELKIEYKKDQFGQPIVDQETGKVELTTFLISDRLEERKALLRHSIATLEAIDMLLALPEGEMESVRLSAYFLMPVPKTPTVEPETTTDSTEQAEPAEVPQTAEQTQGQAETAQPTQEEPTTVKIE